MITKGNRVGAGETNRRVEVGKLILKYRTDRGLSLSWLGKKTNRTAAYLSYVERGKRSFTLETLVAISRALQLKAHENAKLFRLAGAQSSLISDSIAAMEPTWTNRLKQFLDDAGTTLQNSADKATLLADLTRTLSRHKSMRPEIQRILVPLPAWQFQLISPDNMLRMVNAIVEESNAADIRSVGIVGPAQLVPTVTRELSALHKGIAFHAVTQNPSGPGLGPAILAAQDYISNDEAFAVALPDIQVPRKERPNILTKLQRLYIRSRCSVIAVRKATKLRYIRKGAVVRLDDSEPTDQETHLVKGIEYREVGADQHYVMGRYVLTSGIFDVLREMSPDKEGFVRLGSALEQLLQRESIHAVDIGDIAVSSFSLPQEIFNEIIGNLTKNPDDFNVEATLDALSIQLSPWSIEAQTFEAFLEILQPLTGMGDRQFLSQLPVTLKLLQDKLQGKPFPFELWASCLGRSIGVMSLVPMIDRFPATVRSQADTLRLELTRLCRASVHALMGSLAIGHKTQTFFQLWTWAAELEMFQRLIDDLRRGELAKDLPKFIERGRRRISHPEGKYAS